MMTQPNAAEKRALFKRQRLKSRLRSLIIKMRTLLRVGPELRAQKGLGRFGCSRECSRVSMQNLEGKRPVRDWTEYGGTTLARYTKVCFEPEKSNAAR